MALSEAYVAWETELKGTSRQEGRQEGRQEEKVTIALNMLQRSIAPDVVAEVTGLTIAQIQQLAIADQ
jgi:predicted transposase/invertase (TIGR01784 family)